MKVNKFLSTLKYISYTSFHGVLLGMSIFITGRAVIDFLFKYMIPFDVERFLIHWGLIAIGVFLWSAQTKMHDYNTGTNEYHQKKYYFLWGGIGVAIGMYCIDILYIKYIL